jgi:hypothetical protein
MGRQKTLWIDEECWAKLESMGEGSISSKVRRAIKEHSGVHEEELTAALATIEALRKQIKSYQAVVRDGEEVQWWMIEKEWEALVNES